METRVFAAIGDTSGKKFSKEVRVEIHSEASTDVEEMLTWTTDSVLEYVLELEKDGELEKIVHRIQKENLREADWQNWVDLMTISSQLGDALNSFGVDGSYRFAIVDKEGNPFDSFASESFGDVSTGIEVSAPMFPNELRNRDINLVLQLPEAFKHILIDIWILLIASLLTTILMAWIFILTIRRLISQSKLNALKNDFINNMSHELKTPLATISLAVDSLRHPDLDKKEISSLADTIRSEQNRILGHVERVLQVAQSSKGSLPMDRSIINFNELIHETVEELKLLAAEKEALISIADIDPTLSVKGDRLQLKEAIQNIVENALKYCAATPKIDISFSATSDEVTLHITDNGIGIAPEDHNRIFEKFYRATTGNIHDIKGFGLGLTYSKNVIESHGGSIELESSINAGTTFRISLPREA